MPGEATAVDSVANNVRIGAPIGIIINLSFFISAGRRQDPVLESVLVRRTGGVSGLTRDDFAPKSPPFAISPVFRQSHVLNE